MVVGVARARLVVLGVAWLVGEGDGAGLAVISVADAAGYPRARARALATRQLTINNSQ